jgi:hypothetical protein
LLINSQVPDREPPEEDKPPSNDRPVDSTGPYCPSATHKEDVAAYEFPIGADLTIVQLTYDGDDGYRAVNVKTAGEIRLRRVPKDSSHGNQAFITVDARVSDPSLKVIQTWDHTTRVLHVSTPKYARLDGKGPHCVSLEITAWFPENAEFTTLLIEAIHLTLRVMEDIKINVSGQSTFGTITGQVAFPQTSLLGSTTERPTISKVAPSTNLDDGVAASSSTSRSNTPFSSRRIVVETVSGSITGCYPLMDYLGVSSQAGSIKISVFPQPVLPDAPAPAELEAQTTAGSIEINLPVRGAVNPTYIPPPRDYTTRVQSSAGSIMGSFYLGSVSNFRTVSSSIHLTAMPVLQAGNADDSGLSPNTFDTHTVNGKIDVEVLDPIFITMVPYADERPQRPPPSNPYLPIGDDDPYLILPPSMDETLFKVDDLAISKNKTLRNLMSSHGSQSGSVSVRYPAVWEGTLHAKTVSGSITAVGQGLRLIREKKSFASSELLMRKGVDTDDEGCFVEMSDIAGSLHFHVGPLV